MGFNFWKTVTISMENHHLGWENSLFLWPFSVANCMFTRGCPLDSNGMIFCGMFMGFNVILTVVNGISNGILRRIK